MSAPLLLMPQEPPLAVSHYHFSGQLVSTPAAITEFGPLLIVACYVYLQGKAAQFDGIDYLQVFADPKDWNRKLWFIDDVEHVTALLPEDY